MKKNNTIEELKQVLENSHNMLIISHILPDGDNIGSVLGMTLLFTAMGKKVTPIANGTMPYYYEFLSHSELLQPVEAIHEGNYDLVLALDMSDRERGGDLGDFWEQCPVVMNIDHHHTNTYFGDYNYVDGEAASNTQILTELILAWGWSLTKEIAEAFYTGMLTDSGSFTYPATSAKTLALASELMKFHPDLPVIRSNVFENVTFKRKKILGKVLTDAVSLCDGRLVYSSLAYGDCAALEANGPDFEGVIDHLIGVTGVEFAVFFREMEQGITKVGFRGRKGRDVTAVAAQFGGGGHKAAGGCTMEGDFSQCVKAVIDASIAYL
ncbi:MAG: DHH family phosphoesterase, partial [Bacillota bacterium]|nr:DHH family phosphoesterase [Bacillota bacterium]